jgi:predicted RNA binding protein YcfA (HicA-like mRNA interferase family)
MKSSELFRMLKREGWYVISSKGSHLRMTHKEKGGIIIFPYHGSKEMNKGIVKRIKKDAGLK